MAVSAQGEVAIRRKLTPDDVFDMLCRGQLDADVGYELVEGELIEVPPAADDHGASSVNLVVALGIFARQAGGRVYDSSTGFMVGSDFTQLRSPDVSYVSAGRARPHQGRFIHGAPDLAVEVLSRGQHGLAYALPKVREYFDAGAQLVWLVDLGRQEVRIHRAGSAEIVTVRGDGFLTLEPVASGFTLSVSDIFR